MTGRQRVRRVDGKWTVTGPSPKSLGERLGRGRKQSDEKGKKG